MAKETEADRLKAHQREVDAKKLKKAEENLAKAKEGVARAKEEFKYANNPKTGNIGQAVRKHVKQLGKEIAVKAYEFQTSNAKARQKEELERQRKK